MVGTSRRPGHLIRRDLLVAGVGREREQLAAVFEGHDLAAGFHQEDFPVCVDRGAGKGVVGESRLRALAGCRRGYRAGCIASRIAPSALVQILEPGLSIGYRQVHEDLAPPEVLARSGAAVQGQAIDSEGGGCDSSLWDGQDEVNLRHESSF